MNKEPEEQSGEEKPSPGGHRSKKIPEQPPGSTIPDQLSELKNKLNKFDFDKLLNCVKSMLGSEKSAIQVDVNDSLGNKILQIKQLAQELSRFHLRLSKDLTKLDHLLAEAFKDIEALRGQQGRPEKKDV